MERERDRSTGSFSSIVGRGGGAVSETSDGKRSRMLTLSSVATSVMRRNASKVEVVDMPGGAMLVKVNEEDVESLQGSVDGARTLAGVVETTDTNLVDKIIKQEMAHHSPAVGKDGQEEESQDEVVKAREEEDDDGEADDPVFAFGATNLLQHLHLALAAPTLFRFPALAYKWSSDQGSGFLAAYTLVLLLFGFPLSVLEQTLAQFSSLGPATIFSRCLPVLAGVGIGMICMCGVLIPYTSTVLAWSVRYTLDCLQSEVPWSDCPNQNNTGCPEELTPSEYYFMRTILGARQYQDDHNNNGGVVVLSLGLTQALIWLALILAVWRGEAWRAGVVTRIWSLVTVGVLVVLVAYGLNRTESGDGLGRAFVFTWRDLDNPEIWLDAFGQVIWSIGPCIGLLINRASYRRFRDRIRLDAYTAIVANLLIAMISCLAVFPYLNTHRDIEKTPGFFLVEASKAVTYMEVPQIGGVLLFLGLCKALFDHTQILATTVTVGISDLLPGRWRDGMRFFLCCVVVCLLGFASSLPFSTHDGVFLVRAVDTYSPWGSGLLIGVLEVVGLVYVYGAANIGNHFRLMLRSNVKVLVFAWRILLLPILLSLSIWACVVGVQGPLKWETLQRPEAEEEGYKIAGLVVSLVPAALVLITTLLLLLRHAKVIRKLLEPTEAWGPALAGHLALYTPTILRAKAKAPYLVVQIDVEGSDDLPDKGWLPFGFFRVPSQSETQLLEITNGPMQVLLARYLKSRYSNMACSDISGDEEEDESEVTEEEHWSHLEVGTAAYSTSIREGNNNTVSSGVLLQPKNLPENRGQKALS